MSSRAASSDTHRHSIETIGGAAVFVSLALIYFGFGAMKFTAYEAEGLVDFVGNSPLLSWTYGITSHRGFAAALGALELVIGTLLLCRFVSPALSAAGAALSLGLFLVTLSLMFSTPGMFAPEAGGFPVISVVPGQFLFKDVGLFAASLWALGESLTRMKARGEPV